MIPDYCDAITAYRAFDVHENGLLTGQAHAEPWPPYQAFVGRCGAISGTGWQAHIRDGAFTPAPVWGCDCGIHALKSEESAERRVTEDRWGFSWDTGNRPPGRAWGRVKLWGRLIEHTLGYRAEFAYPFDLVSDSKPLAEKIAALYGVPCAFKAMKSRPDRTERIDFGQGFLGSYQSIPFTPRTYQTYWLSSYGVVTSLADAQDTPMIVSPPAPMTVKPQIVKANRWQTRQYAKQQQGPSFTLPDWRETLRQMVFA